MKPFIKPRPASPPQQSQPEPQNPSISLNELTVFALAAAMSDPADRAAYLERTCGADEDLHKRVEARLATHNPEPHTPAEKAPQHVQTALLRHEPSRQNGEALALVPVSAMQFPTLPPQMQRQVTFAWSSATIMALAVGALAVFFYFEKDARARAEVSLKEAKAAAQQSQLDREQSDARALESRTDAQRTAEARAKAEQERDAAAIKSTAAAQEAERLRAEADKHKAASEQTLTTAKSEREQMLASQRASFIALADSLATLANLQLAAKSFAEADTNARQCLELRTVHGIEGWPLVEAHALVGEASLQRNADADAERELTAAGAAIESLGPPNNDADRARFTAASKRIVLFFNASGRRKEGVEWKRRLDAAVAPRQQ